MKKCIFLLLVIVFFSCSDEKSIETELYTDDLTLEEKYSLVANEESFVISVEDMQNVVRDFFINNISTKANDFDINFGKVKINYHLNSNSITKAQNSSDSVAIYEFELLSDTTKGFSVVIADKRFPGVVAFVPNGKLSDTIFNKGMASFFSSLSDGIDEQLSYFNTIKDKYLKSAQRKIKEVDCHYTFNSSNRIFYTRAFELYGQTEINLITKWNQNSPYNDQCYCQTHPNLHAPAGCVAVAVAQVMAYHKYPDLFNWSLITQGPKVSNSDAFAATQVSFLMKAIGMKVGMKYDCNGSSSNIYNANSALNDYGYSTDGVQDWNWTKVVNSIRNGNPVIMRGQDLMKPDLGHQWVVDGFAYKTVTATTGRDNPIIYYATGNFVKTNWGWGGLDDGYFESERHYHEGTPSQTVNATYYPRFYTSGGRWYKGIKILPNIRK